MPALIERPSTPDTRLRAGDRLAALPRLVTIGSVPRRPLPRVGDNLDRLLDLLDQARLEQARRTYPSRGPDAPYRSLLAVLN